MAFAGIRCGVLRSVAGMDGTAARLAASAACHPPLLPCVHLAGEGTGRMATTIGFHPRLGAAPPSCKKAESDPAPSLQDAVDAGEEKVIVAVTAEEKAIVALKVCDKANKIYNILSKIAPIVVDFIRIFGR